MLLIWSGFVLAEASEVVKALAIRNLSDVDAIFFVDFAWKEVTLVANPSQDRMGAVPGFAGYAKWRLGTDDLRDLENRPLPAPSLQRRITNVLRDSRRCPHRGQGEVVGARGIRH